MRLIDGDRLEDVIEDKCFNYISDSDFNAGIQNGLLIARDFVQEAPTIDAEPIRHGKWIWEEQVYKCSVCSHKAYGNILECMDGTYKFCPACGAKLEGVYK